MTKDQLLKALNDYFSDMSRPQEETLEDLREIREEVGVLIQALQEDIGL